jgi:hypothetical protein
MDVVVEFGSISCIVVISRLLRWYSRSQNRPILECWQKILESKSGDLVPYA